jgi:hypothetical protein
MSQLVEAKTDLKVNRKLNMAALLSALKRLKTEISIFIRNTQEQG